MIRGPHCYAFFEGIDAFATHEAEITAFYLTDFLVKQFDLDAHGLLEMIFGHYTELVYQAQTEDPALHAKAKDRTRPLGLEFVYRFTGHGDLTRALTTAAQKY